jgi:hypothetical protein
MAKNTYGVTMRTKRKACLIMFSTILPLLAVVCFTLASTSLLQEEMKAPEQIAITDVSVWHIGSSNPMLDAVINRMKTLGTKKTTHLETNEFFDSYDSESIGLNELSLVVFDGNWISERVSNSAFHRFLNEAPRRRARLVAIGGQTSKFFEALDQAGVNKLGRDSIGDSRNPAYFDPPLVGFRLKQANTPEGVVYSYPSVFVSNTESADGMVQAFINW